LGGRKGIRPAKKLSGGVLAWLSVCSEVPFLPPNKQRQSTEGSSSEGTLHTTQYP